VLCADPPLRTAVRPTWWEAADARRAQETEDLLVAELQHRTKNLFAVVHALALRSLRGDQTLDQGREAFVGQLEALARADQRLANSAWKGTSLHALVLSELEPFSGRVRVEGVEVTLSPQAAQSFALALHELTTNASKYGALSRPTA
jgi:two-component sensor histidine kinase